MTAEAGAPAPRGYLPSELHDVQASPASGSLAGRLVALSSLGEALELPFVHAGRPLLAERGRSADPRVAGNTGVTQGVHVHPILVDPCVYLTSGPCRNGRRAW